MRSGGAFLTTKAMSGRVLTVEKVERAFEAQKKIAEFPEIRL